MNTRLRAAVQNEFEKDFYTLMTMERPWKILGTIDMELVTSQDKYSIVMKSKFKDRCLFICCKDGENWNKYNKPVYPGKAIQDLSQIFMFAFHND